MQDLKFSKGSAVDPQRQWFPVREVIDAVVGELAPRLTAQRIETITDIPGQLVIHADRQFIRTTLTILAANALDAMPQGGRLFITSLIGPRGFELEVADSGTGLGDEARRRAFEPAFTTKRDAAGMGLTIARRLAQSHGGELVATNCPEGGAAFTLRLPQRSLAAAA